MSSFFPDNEFSNFSQELLGLGGGEFDVRDDDGCVGVGLGFDPVGREEPVGRVDPVGREEREASPPVPGACPPIGAQPVPSSRPRKNSQSRGWVFTANTGKAFSDSELHERITAAGQDLELRYCVCGRETAPKTGRLHYQGYLYRGGKLSFNQVSRALEKSFGVHCYVAAARGDHDQNRDYCTKDGNFVEYGSLPRQGNRSDLAVIAKMIDNGSSIKDIAMSNPASYIRYHGGLNVMFMQCSLNKC